MIEQLIRAGVHLGSNPKRTKEGMKKYRIGWRENREIIDIRQTYYLLKVGARIVEEIQKKGGKIMIAVPNKMIGKVIERYLKKNEQCVVIKGRGFGGILTNWKNREENEEEKRNEKIKEKKTQKKSKALKKGYDLLITLQGSQNLRLLKEARHIKLPTLAIMDTDADPNLATLTIPGNEETVRGQLLYIILLFSRVKNQKNNEKT